MNNGSAYIETTATLLFEFDGVVCRLTLPKNYKGSLDWRDIIDVEYIEIAK